MLPGGRAQGYRLDRVSSPPSTQKIKQMKSCTSMIVNLPLQARDPQLFKSPCHAVPSWLLSELLQLHDHRDRSSRSSSDTSFRSYTGAHLHSLHEVHTELNLIMNKVDDLCVFYNSWATFSKYRAITCNLRVNFMCSCVSLSVRYETTSGLK